MFKLKLIKTGNVQGILFSKKVISKLDLREGQDLYLIEKPNGVEITKLDPEKMKTLEKIDEILREYGEVFQALAK